MEAGGLCGEVEIEAFVEFTDGNRIGAAQKIIAVVSCPDSASFTPAITSEAPQITVKVAPAYSTGTSGKTFWSIQYFWGDGRSETENTDGDKTHVYSECGDQTVNILLTIGNPVDPAIGAIVMVANETLDVQCVPWFQWTTGLPSYNVSLRQRLF